MIALLDSSGSAVARYEYGAWGDIRSITDGSGVAVASSTHIANINPLRYRGYYYDAETGFYYLQSRYYDPVIKRFINADSQIEMSLTEGLNLFAYCSNNPVMNSDPTGHSAVLLSLGILAAATLLLAAIATVTAVYANEQNTSRSRQIPASTSFARSVEKSISDYTVYKLVDENSEVQYVGRTKNIEARQAAHSNSSSRGHLEFQVIQSDLTYEAARGLEQAYMIYYHTINCGNPMNNQINGISPLNAKLKIYVDSALKYLENQISNDLLCWAGM